jgi:serine/threonine-protein kinase
VLVDGAAMPAAHDLPEDLEALAWRNAVELRHAYWESDLRVLAAALKEIVPESADATLADTDQSKHLAVVDGRDVSASGHRRLASFALAATFAIATMVSVIVISERDPPPAKPPPIATAPEKAPDGPAASHASSPVARTPVPPRASAANADPGTIVVSAVGLADATGARSGGEASSLQRDARADSNRQVVEKALGLLVDRQSLEANYGAFEPLLSNSDNFIERVVQQNDPQIGKDGFVSVTTQAVVNVDALRKSLNEMSRRDRLELIRARGDPKISLSISVRDADQPATAPRASAVAENVLKERIRSFGFRTWSSEAGGRDGRRTEPDFIVTGEAGVKKLSMRLEASGLVITKFALTSWTVKCIDRATGEEIYFNTTLAAAGSWTSEEQALKAIGTKVADEFSREFFLEHTGVASQTIVMAVDGMPSGRTRTVFERELVSLPAVIAATPRPSRREPVYDVQLAGGGTVADIVAADVLKPLNAKLGQPCFDLGGIHDDQVTVVFDGDCGEHPVLARLETYPPAGLYGAPMGRRLSVVKNPDTLRKLTT